MRQPIVALIYDFDKTLSPKDMQATAYSLLGYDEAAMIPDQQGRPHPIAGDGRVRRELLG